jgi:hypothetical protein
VGGAAVLAGAAAAVAQPSSIVGPERDTDPLSIAPANNNAPPTMACGDDRCAVSNAVVDATTGAILSRDWPAGGDVDCHGEDCLIAGPDLDQPGFLRLERASLATSAVATSTAFPFPPGASANGLTKISCPGPTCVLAWSGSTHWLARIDLATATPLDPEWIAIDAPAANKVAAAMDCTDQACLIALAHDLGGGTANGLGAYQLDLQTGRASLTFSKPAEGEPATNYYYRNVGCAGDRCLIVFAPGYHRSNGDPISSLAVDMISGSVGPRAQIGFTSSIPSQHFDLGSYALACTGGRCLLNAPFRAEQWLDLETGAPSGAMFNAMTALPRSDAGPWVTYHSGVACTQKGCIIGRTLHVVNFFESPGLGNLVISRIDPTTPTTTPAPHTIVSLADNWQRDPRVACSGTSCLVVGLDHHSYGWQTWVNGTAILPQLYTPRHWPFGVRFDAASGQTFGERSLIYGDTEWGGQGSDPFCGTSSCAIVAGASVPERIVSLAAGAPATLPWSGLQRKLGLTCTEEECFAWGRRSSDPADTALASTRLDLTARSWAPLADVAGIVTADASSCERASCLFVSRDSMGVVSGRRVVLGGDDASVPVRLGEAAAAGTLTVSCAGGTCLVSWIDQQGAVHASAVQLERLEVAAVAGAPIASASATKVTAGCRPGECLLAWLGRTGPMGENDVFGARVATERAALVDTTPLALVSSPENERAASVAPADDQRYVLAVERVHPDGVRIKIRVVDFLSRFPPAPDAGAPDVPSEDPDGGVPGDGPADAGDAGAASDAPPDGQPDAPTGPPLDGGSEADGGRSTPPPGDGCTCQLERGPASSAIASSAILMLVASMLHRRRRHRHR